jgi:TPR repeat protein
MVVGPAYPSACPVGGRIQNPCMQSTLMAVILRAALLAMSGSLLQGADDLSALTSKAKAGDIDAQGRLASVYFEGRGVEPNPLLALRWATKPAEQDDLVCVQMVAMIHFQGKGMKRDLPEASKWFAKAAVLGDANAAFTLGLMNDEGQGIPKDAVEAFAWYEVSKALSRDVAATVRYALALEKKMTSKQVEAAKGRAAEILKQVERKKDELYDKRLAIMKAANPQMPIEELRKQLPR